MRIGEFSKKHNITRDTVRHYLDMGLLLAKKDGCHYKFDNSHHRDISKIMELKALDFTLLEIQKLLNFNRLAGNNSTEYNNYYLNILEDKKDQVLQHQKRYIHMETALKEKIENIEESKKNPIKKLGIKIDSLDLLNCPICKKDINICGGNIENNMIIRGSILCECGYRSKVEEGIFIDENMERFNVNNKDKIVSKLEFIKDASTEFINFYYDGMHGLMENLKKHGKSSKYVLELEKCSGTFLMQYIDNIPKDCTYILINKDLRRLKKIKSNIESEDIHHRFMFICADFDNIPIRDNSIDIVIDHWMTKDYATENGGFLPEKISPLMKEDGIIVGTYPCITNINTDIYMEELEEQGYFNFKKLAEKFENHSILENSIETIGPLIEENPYNSNMKNKKLYLNIYAGRKKLKV